MASVCNWLQEAASLNAEALSFSKSNFEASGENISWVLTHLKVRMSRFPKWGETVSILTFPRGGRKIVAYRDFILYGEDGGEIGHASSEWMLIDLASRKVVAIPDGVFAAANTVREPVFGEEPFAHAWAKVGTSWKSRRPPRNVQTGLLARIGAAIEIGRSRMA